MTKSPGIIWDLRTDKVVEEVKAGRRLDGRAFDEYREIQIFKDISKNAEGSARVKLGNTEVVAGVKMLPGEPYPDSPDEGTISVGAELLPIASPVFEFGPPSPDSIELARVVDRGIRESKALDFKKLCIREGELVWVVFIDFYALNDDGNLFDASAIAALASLLEAKIPKLEDDKIVKGEFSGKLKLERKPLLSTFGKISNNLLLDTTLAEQHSQEGRFSVATTEDNYISAIQKGGRASFTVSELDNAIDIAMKKTKEIRKKL